MEVLDDSVINCLVEAFMFELGLVDKTKQVDTSYEGQHTSNNEEMIQKYVHVPDMSHKFPTFIQSFSMIPSSQGQEEDSDTDSNTDQCPADNPPFCYSGGLIRIENILI